jgi:uncharacterized membrane protein
VIKAVLYALLGGVVLLLPGFLLSLVAYPERNQLDLPSRLAVSVGLGVLLNAYLGIVLGRLGLLRTSPFLLACLLLCAGLGLAAFWRGAYPFSSLRGLLARSRERRPAQTEERAGRGEN